MVISLRKTFYAALLSACCSFGQILLSGTSFDPKVASDTGKAFWSVNDIKYTGIAQGALTVYPPLASNVKGFDAAFQYGITNNPVKLDSLRYQNLPLGSRDNQLVVSPNRATTNYANILSYKVAGLAPNSKVEVRVTYCSVANSTDTTCLKSVNFLRGVVNPEEYYSRYGIEGPLVQASKCADFVVTETTVYSRPIGANGELIFYLNESGYGNCKAVAVKSIEVWGTPKPQILVAEGPAVCTTEPLHLSTSVAYEGSYKWELLSDTTWTEIGSGRDIVYTPQVTGDLQFRVVLKPFGSNTAYTSSVKSVSVSNCCGNNMALSTIKTIFYDDFGSVDLSDPTGKTYQVLDYISDPDDPKLVKKTTTTPFRWPLEVPPMGTIFGYYGPVDDGQYTVASYMTAYQAYNGIDGAQLGWANDITGQIIMSNPDLGYDHSGKLEGAALLVNIPPDTTGQIIYTRQMDAGCDGLTINAEAWITVFTNAANGPYSPVKVKLRLRELADPSNVAEVSGTATRQGDGGGFWVPVRASLSLKESAYIMELINDQGKVWYGNDLVVDDIKVRACIPNTSPCAVVTKDQDGTLSNAGFLYPNPTEGVVSLPDYKKYRTYKIFDGQGNLLKSETVLTDKIDVSDLKQGLYTVLLMNKDGQVQRRIVKE